METLAVSVLAESIYHVELNRPQARNAMNYQFWGELRRAFDYLASEGDCRVVVVSARGKSFSAGLDLTDPDNMAPAADEVARRGFKFMAHVKVMQDAISSIEQCLKPVVVAVHGACVGAGVDFITAADVRVCSQDSFFCVKEAAVGLAADVGTLARLPKIVGNDSIVREMALTAANIQAQEARSCGLVSRVLESKEAALAEATRIAGLIAANSPVAVLGTKKNLNFARDHSVQESLDYVSTWNACMIQADDLMKAASASFTKQKATFSKL